MGEIVQEEEFDTLDILNDIYRNNLSEDTSFDFVTNNFVERKDSREETTIRERVEPTHYDYVKKKLEFYPLSSFSSNGYSCLNLIDLSNISFKYGPDCFSLYDTQFYQMCIYDQSKLFESTAKLEPGETFAVRSSCFTSTNTPVYMKYYKKKSETDENQITSLLSEPIQILFKKIFDPDEDDEEEEDVDNYEMVFKKKKKKKKSANDDGLKSMNWVNKYSPQYFSDLLTSENVNLECLKWLSSWKCSSNYLDKYQEPENRILLVGGPSGVGKTSLVHVLAKHCGYNVVEINSSEGRNKGRVVPIINGVVSAGSVAPNKPNLCLLEDVDTLLASEYAIISHLRNINGKKDTNGGPYIKRPIICTCTDVYSRQLKELRDISKVVILDTCDSSILQGRLECILDEEGIYMPEEFLKELLEVYKNDIRSCITALEFITNYSEKSGNLSLSHLSKDSNEGISKLLKTVFGYQKINSNSIETLLLSTINTLGYNYTSSAISENVTNMPMKRFDHLFKLSIFDDIMAQSDVLCNRQDDPHQKIQLLKVSCSFLNNYICNPSIISNKLVYPQRTSFHSFNIRIGKSKNIIHSIKKSSFPIVAQAILSNSFPCDVLPYLLKFLSKSNKEINNQSLSFINRLIKALDGCWDGLFPYTSFKLPMNIYPLVHSTQILVLYGISIVNVNQSLVYDPPVSDLYLKPKQNSYFFQIPERFSQLIVNFIEFYKAGNKNYFIDDTHFKGSSHYKVNQFSNFYDAVKFIYNNGFEKFKNLNKDSKKEQIKDSKELLCKRTHDDLVPILFSQMILNDTLILKQFAHKRKKLNMKTCGNYKYQDQSCSAVRYIINQL